MDAGHPVGLTEFRHDARDDAMLFTMTRLPAKIVLRERSKRCPGSGCSPALDVAAHKRQLPGLTRVACL